MRMAAPLPRAQRRGEVRADPRDSWFSIASSHRVIITLPVRGSCCGMPHGVRDTTASAGHRTGPPGTRPNEDPASPARGRRSWPLCSRYRRLRRSRNGHLDKCRPEVSGPTTIVAVRPPLRAVEQPRARPRDVGGPGEPARSRPPARRRPRRPAGAALAGAVHWPASGLFSACVPGTAASRPVTARSPCRRPERGFWHVTSPAWNLLPVAHDPSLTDSSELRRVGERLPLLATGRRIDIVHRLRPRFRRRTRRHPLGKVPVWGPPTSSRDCDGARATMPRYVRLVRRPPAPRERQRIRHHR